MNHPSGRLADIFYRSMTFLSFRPASLNIYYIYTVDNEWKACLVKRGVPLESNGSLPISLLTQKEIDSIQKDIHAENGYKSGQFTFGLSINDALKNHQQQNPYFSPKLK